MVLLINTQTSIPSWLNNRVGKDRKIRKKSDNHCKQAGRRHGSLRCKRAMFTPETRQTDSNIVILTEPFKITCWWCCYVHHRPKWCFSDKKLRNLMPWFCREFAAIFVTFSIVYHDFWHFYRDFLNNVYFTINRSRKLTETKRIEEHELNWT